LFFFGFTFFRKVQYIEKPRVLKGKEGFGSTWQMESSWEWLDIASSKTLQGVSSVVSPYAFSSYCDVLFYQEVPGADVSKLKKGQIEHDGEVFEQITQNLFAFVFGVQRQFDHLATLPHLVYFFLLTIFIGCLCSIEYC
jgi:hypothetical protein